MKLERRGPRLVLGLALAALPRLIAFPLNENLYGDAVARTWLAEQWALRPHVIAGFDGGAAQFGPLHIYLLALARWVWPSAEDAGRALSLIVGVATVIPLEALTKRLAGPRAALWAMVVFGCWGVHIQCSTTSASEALNLLLVVSSIALLAAHFEERRGAQLLGAALALNLACATRYDSWLLVPLLAVCVAWRVGLRAALGFAVASSAFAVPWLFGNFVDRGNPLFAFKFIDDFHRAWYVSEAAFWGWRYPYFTGFFWPGAALATLTPLVALAGFAGLFVVWRKQPQWRWLVLVVVVPAALYTARATLLHSFVPLVRFTLKELVLLMPFVFAGAQVLLVRAPRLGKALVVVAMVCLVAWPTGLGAFTWRREGKWENSLRPISPTSTNSRFVMEAARWVREHVPPNQVLIVDSDPRGYDDVQVSFFSRVPFEQGARARARSFETRLAHDDWGAMVLFEGGPLAKEVTTGDDGVTVFRGVRFKEVPLVPGPLHLFGRVRGE